jgi:hypothetical protein
MTVPATTRRAGPFNGNGVANTFSFTFKTFSTADLLVIKTSTLGNETTLVLDSDYSVALNVDQDVSPGGTVTHPITGAKLAAGEKLTVVGDLPYEQTTDLLGGGAFNARVIEDTFDRTVVQIQQVQEGVGRALKVPVSSTALDATLPQPQANNVLGWNETATGLQNIDLETLATSVAYASAITDVFSGTGSQTVFALSVNPGAINNLLVAISGVVQTPTVDYTWVSGTTLTFTSAPPAGTGNVLVRYAQAVPVGTLGTQDYGFII